MKSLPFFLATCLLPLTHAIACYNPGSTTQDPFLTPCNNETSFSTCCRTQETCLPNGLCENVQVSNGTETKTYFREGCTDPSWNSSACLTPLNACPNDGNDSVELVEVTPCPNDAVMFCCGSNNTACCDNYSGISLAAEPLVGTNSTTTSTSIPTPTTIALSAPTTTPKPSSSSSHLSPGAKAGIAVASVAVAIVLAALLFYILSRLRRPKGPTSYSAGASSEATMVEIQAVSSAPPYRYGDNTEERGSNTYVKSGMEIEQPVREDEGNALNYEDHRKFRRFSNEIL